MPAIPVRVRGTLAAVVLAIAPLLIHLAMVARTGMIWAGILVIAQATLIAWIALSFVPVPGLRWIGCLTVTILTAAVWLLSRDGIVASSAIPHAIAYLSVLTVFGLSLASGRKPIVTIFAERSRGDLPPSLLLYTRRVTWAWCLFCMAQLLGSLSLLLFATVSLWSMFVNLLNLPLLAAMFCGEFAWRTWRHGGSPRERLTDSFRMAGQIRGP